MIDYERGNSIVMFGEVDGMEHEDSEEEEEGIEDETGEGKIQSKGKSTSSLFPDKNVLEYGDLSLAQFRRAGMRAEYLNDLGFCLGGQ